MIVQIPSDTLAKYKNEAYSISDEGVLSVRELKSVLGKLQHCNAIIKFGTAFLRRFYNQTCGRTNPNQIVKLDSGAIKDLNTWKMFFNSHNGLTILRNPELERGSERTLFTDSSCASFEGT